MNNKELALKLYYDLMQMATALEKNPFCISNRVNTCRQLAIDLASDWGLSEAELVKCYYDSEVRQKT